MSRVEHTSRPLMPAHRIFFHLTWSTLARRPMINAPTRAFLDEYFRNIALQERATIVCLGFLQTHAHLLIRTGPRFDLPRLVQLLKGGSSYAASRQRARAPMESGILRDEREPEAPAPSGRVHRESGRPPPLRGDLPLTWMGRGMATLSRFRFLTP